TIQKLTPADEQSFLLESDNGGAFLKTLGVIGNVKKGRLKMIGSRKNNRAPLKAKISLEKFIVTKTPFLTHFLMTLASPTSFLDLFSNGKIKFNEFFCHVLLEGPLLTVQQGLFQSFNSGISLEGSLNLKDHTMKLEGNLIPAYMLNKPLSIIPILGDILGGGHGDGIGATRFFVDGAIQDPRIRVNPIRIIAPGILKKLFSSFGKSSQEETVKEQKKN
ncbi:MAG: AsmA-like C-terminal domain-containing protein, partial [Holosporales bacterium]